MAAKFIFLRCRVYMQCKYTLKSQYSLHFRIPWTYGLQYFQSIFTEMVWAHRPFEWGITRPFWGSSTRSILFEFVVDDGFSWFLTFIKLRKVLCITHGFGLILTVYYLRKILRIFLYLQFTAIRLYHSMIFYILIQVGSRYKLSLSCWSWINVIIPFGSFFNHKSLKNINKLGEICFLLIYYLHVNLLNTPSFSEYEVKCECDNC